VPDVRALQTLTGSSGHLHGSESYLSHIDQPAGPGSSEDDRLERVDDYDVLSGTSSSSLSIHSEYAKVTTDDDGSACTVKWTDDLTKQVFAIFQVTVDEGQNVIKECKAEGFP
jgi:hypothetical protein